MDAIAESARGTIAERAYEWPTLNFVPPCVVVGYPVDNGLNATYRRGSSRATFPVWVVCGRADERSAREVLGGYIAGEEGGIVRQTFDGDLGGAVQTCLVTTFVVEAVASAGVDYIAARFDLDILT